jgi:transposase-like protein
VFLMAGKKGMKHYPEAIKSEIVLKHGKGQSVNSLSKEFGISRWSVQCWCGLRPEIKIRQIAPLRRGRPRKTPITTDKEFELENKRLKMENELLRSFLQLAGRR